MVKISSKTIGRLSRFRRVLNELMAEGATNVYSYQLAGLTGSTAAQVRRDLMVIGYNGTPVRGYDVKELISSIGKFLDASDKENVVLVGIGNLGRVILSFFSDRHPKISIVAAFDKDLNKINRVVHGCRCYSLNDLPEIVRGSHIRLGIIAVPVQEAQGVAEMLMNAGIRGILNFAPVRLHLPLTIHVEDIDMTMSLEKVAYFTRQAAHKKE